MLIKELTERYKAAGRRYHIVGDEHDGVIMALDVEGRIFAFKDGVVLNRVNEEAIAGISTRDNYINPGGDGFWPAPEGSCLGYEYPTGNWRVPPSLTNARYPVKKSTQNTALAEAEVDLVNTNGVGMPFIFSRDITVSSGAKELTVSITEGIEYIGTREIAQSEAVIAPWSLCQFDCGADCTLTLPKLSAEDVRDLYPWDSSCHRKETENGIEVEMTSNWNKRYRENMLRIKSGDLLEVARVIKGLMERDNEKGLSTGERKMLRSAKQILISELVMTKHEDYEAVELRVNAALAG